MEKCLDEYVTPFFDVIPIVTTTFDLWMSKRAHEIFFTPQWEPCHVCMGLFEANDTIEARLIKQMKVLLETFKVTSKILWFVKDEGTNLKTMTVTLKSLVMSSIEAKCAFSWDFLWACNE